MKINLGPDFPSGPTRPATNVWLGDRSRSAIHLNCPQAMGPNKDLFQQRAWASSLGNCFSCRRIDGGNLISHN